MQNQLLTTYLNRFSDSGRLLKLKTLFSAVVVTAVDDVVVVCDNCIKIGFPGKSIFGDYFQENRTSRRPYLLLRISFPGRPVSIQFIPGVLHAAVGEARREDEDVVDAPDVGAAQVLGSLQHGLLLRKVIVRSN